ncbi:unnamed protein product [Rotaria sp. Silwood1]|nr:unnamed protein product [Rotaria sp. Silwood1]CAF1642524.1 unnamed protein product [Rotaria sp. Silwood1]CAF4970821.1 unnamed protein product [Rotaria sp. Silwood1]
MTDEESSSIRIEQPSLKKCTFYSYFRRIFVLDNVPNQKHHYPIFIIIMSILHIVIYLLTYTDHIQDGHSFISVLYRLGRLYIPCMRPTEQNIRMHSVYCKPYIKRDICYYDELLKYECFSFAYPHQVWRMITVSFLHINWLHLISNLSAQLIQGIPLECKYGTRYILVIYLVSGVGSSLLGMYRLGDKGK